MRKDIPKTTNPVERAIGEFEDRYHLNKGFTSFYYAQFFIKAYQIYYRLRKISFGRFSGKSRLELKKQPSGEIEFCRLSDPPPSFNFVKFIIINKYAKVSLNFK